METLVPERIRQHRLPHTHFLVSVLFLLQLTNRKRMHYTHKVINSADQYIRHHIKGVTSVGFTCSPVVQVNSNFFLKLANNTKQKVIVVIIYDPFIIKRIILTTVVFRY